jgi:hypothetical protein
MDNKIYLTGANGQLGRQVLSELISRNLDAVSIGYSEVRGLNGEAVLRDFIAKRFLGRATPDHGARSAWLILAHRSRTEDIVEALGDELRMTRDLVYAFSDMFAEVRVVVIGSITGGRVDRNSSEAYHYAKDLQKSIVRRSVLRTNVFMNLLELSWFVKYPDSSSQEYTSKIADVRRMSPTRKIVRTNDIADFCVQLLTAQRPPRGQIITLDDGYSLVQ